MDQTYYSAERQFIYCLQGKTGSSSLVDLLYADAKRQDRPCPGNEDPLSAPKGRHFLYGVIFVY